MKYDKSTNIFLEQILENIPYFVFWKNRESQFMGCNDMFARSAGFENAAELVGKTDFDTCWTTEEAEFFRKIDKQVMDEDRPILNLEETQRQLDGSVRTILTSKVPLHNENGEVTGILGIYKDISERKNLELEKDQAILNLKELQEHLIQTEKIRGLGEMAGGIAHEINNPLAIIQSHTHSMLKRLRKGELSEDFATQHLKGINETIDRIGDIIHNLKVISRPDQRAELYPAVVSGFMESVSILWKEKFRNEGVSFEVIYDDKATKSIEFFCNQTSLIQVIVNLLGNAKDAVADCDEKWVKIRVRRKEGLRIQVIDSGPGVRADIEDKIFQPFFTTKEVGSGTGIGLSLSKKLIEKQGGRLVHQKDSEHTCFEVQYFTSNIKNKEVIDESQP